MSTTFLLFTLLLQTFSLDVLGQGKCPPPRACPLVSEPVAPPPFVRPPSPFFPRGRHLLPRQPIRNPGPLANRAQILFITEELKRNITFDPNSYTPTWVGNNYCTFKGFYCDTVPDRNITGLAGIDFSGAGFRGNLNFYRFIMNLPDIAIFHVNDNNFSGVIGAGLSSLRYLYEVDLSNNTFKGVFPLNVLGATKLTFIDIRFNGYLGTVPDLLFNADTDILFINNNGFNQRIPANFGNTPARYLTVANNRFTGSIPTSIGRAWRTLTEVLFLGNRLTGCLPYEIGYLTRMTVFDAGSNLLTGPIPRSFGCLQSLEFLNLAYNQFYGPVPEVLCRLRMAYNFTLTYNYFTQVGPECLALIKAGVLNVNRNCIMGLPFQRPVAECTRFFSRRQPRVCPRPETFSITPCTPPASTLRIRVAPTKTVPTPRTYQALAPPPPM
ncbi:hypothetical protein K2173_026150 [Erythroxylum novogranatense]|uniref:Leucine-rich repeat-containing N-terminal plant-type domain-containing protein n=1 Tax=Erythroxylum novogranatense TaxID=1862640 RepID=A0AAV8TA86_9ROSI|nr:hypothetical protein K2173_026150 [Erythroxylum novogranatense]